MWCKSFKQQSPFKGESNFISQLSDLYLRFKTKVGTDLYAKSSLLTHFLDLFNLVTNVIIFAALLENIQWDVRTLSYLSFYYDIRKRTFFYLTQTRNLTKIICVFSAHWQCK